MTIEENTPLHRWLITIAVMLAAVVEILDSTIVNVSLPDMMGSLSADTDQITWVLTSYIVAAAIFMPLTGFLVNRLGRKRLLLMNIVGFLIASMLCGLSTSLLEIVVFRTIQGIFGASLVPLSQFIIRDTFPPHEQGKAMAIWGIGIMAGPILGPTLGGYITETLNWRWIFYVNVPVCIVAFFLTLRVIKESPLVPQHLDWMGLILMATGLGSLQLLLDRGNVDDWFSSSFIQILTVVTIFSLVTFVVRGWNKPDNIINLKLFKDPYFGGGTLLLSFFVGIFFACIVLQPIFMETLLNYPTDVAGWVMAPRGVATACSMAIVGRLIQRVDPRKLIAFGLALSAIGTWFSATLTLDVSSSVLIEASLIQGFGVGFFFVPLSTLVFANIPKASAAEGSGLFAFGRSMGSSLGISLLTTYLTRDTQSNWNELSHHLNRFNPNVHHWFHVQQLSLSNPTALPQLQQALSTQASMLAFVHVFSLGAFILCALIPLIFLMKQPPRSAQANDIAAH